MRKQHWPKRDPVKNYFPLPNEIFSQGEENAVLVKQGRRAGTGMVHGQTDPKRQFLQKRPPNCCNSSAACRVSENTA